MAEGNQWQPRGVYSPCSGGRNPELVSRGQSRPTHVSNSGSLSSSFTHSPQYDSQGVFRGRSTFHHPRHTTETTNYLSTNQQRTQPLDIIPAAVGWQPRNTRGRNWVMVSNESPTSTSSSGTFGDTQYMTPQYQGQEHHREIRSLRHSSHTIETSNRSPGNQNPPEIIPAAVGWQPRNTRGKHWIMVSNESPTSTSSSGTFGDTQYMTPRYQGQEYHRGIRSLHHPSHTMETSIRSPGNQNPPEIIPAAVGWQPRNTRGRNWVMAPKTSVTTPYCTSSISKQEIKPTSVEKNCVATAPSSRSTDYSHEPHTTNSSMNHTISGPVCLHTTSQHLPTNNDKKYIYSVNIHPVCVGVGDAIIITITIKDSESGENSLQCYLVDGSKGGRRSDLPMVSKAFKEFCGPQGEYLNGIIITHPDEDHYRGVQQLVESYRLRCPILLTDQFLGEANHNNVEQCLKSLEQCGYVGRHLENPNPSDVYPHFPRCFNFQCFNTTLVLYEYRGRSLSVNRPTNKHRHGNTNDTSIVLTITDPSNPDRILACLTGDININIYQTEQIRAMKQIPILLVPHHGSKYNSEYIFYKRCQVDTYLISCGNHKRFRFPDKEVLGGICHAAIEAKRRVCIILTNGRHLNSGKMSDIHTVHNIDLMMYITICYWDEYLYKIHPVIANPWLNLSAESTDRCILNTIEWSIEGYKKLIEQVREGKQIQLTLQVNGTRYLSIKNERNQIWLNTTTEPNPLNVIHSLPSPLDPCNWETDKVLVLADTLDVPGTSPIFLQPHTGATARTYDEFTIFQCVHIPWVIQYGSKDIATSGLVNWIDTIYQTKQLYDRRMLMALKY